MATTSVLAASTAPLTSQCAVTPDPDGVCLRIFDVIEPGFGIVPLVGNNAGSHMLRQGEIAIYDQSWHGQLSRGERELEPGLYCLERQRPPALMPNRMLAERFAADDPVQMMCERLVVHVVPFPRREQAGLWAYREVRSRLHHGVRVPDQAEGPYFATGLINMLLGPIVGIYRPQIGSAN